MTTSLESRIWLPHGASAIIFRDGKILACGRRTSALWCFPGGKIDPGESPLQAMLREAHEEVGLTLNPASCHCIYEGICTSIDPADRPYWVYAFLCQIDERAAPRNMPGEPAFQWMSPDDFLRESAFREFNAVTLRHAGII